MRVDRASLQQMKAEGRPITMLTAYDFPSARLADRAGVPVLLVGDSLGMVVHGHDTTLPVTLDDMVRHTAAVVRGSARAMVVGDLPFLTYADESQAVASAARLMREAGAGAVKLEGGAPVLGAVRRLTELGVPVMGHLGFTPQSQHQLGLKVQGRDPQAARRLIEDALALEAAGALAVVLELVPAPLAAEVSRRLAVPTIGIGAGAGCDGQVQVWHDLLGLGDHKPPRHAKAYAELGDAVLRAVTAYREEVERGDFPTAAQSASMSEADLRSALEGLA